MFQFFLKVDVETRWTAEQLRTHPFLDKSCKPGKIIPLIKAVKQQIELFVRRR